MFSLIFLNEITDGALQIQYECLFQIVAESTMSNSSYQQKYVEETKLMIILLSC